MIAHDARQGRASTSYLRAFGFGQTDRARLPGRGAGPRRSPLAEYNDTSLASMPIGYGIAVTRDADARRVRDDRQRRHGAPAAPGRRDDRRATASATTQPLPSPHQVVSAETADAGRRACCSRWSPTSGTGAKAQIPGLPGRRQDRDRAQAAVRAAAVQVRSRRSSGSRRPTTPGSRPSWCSTSRRCSSILRRPTSRRRCSARSCSSPHLRRVPPSQPAVTCRTTQPATPRSGTAATPVGSDAAGPDDDAGPPVP